MAYRTAGSAPRTTMRAWMSRTPAGGEIEEVAADELGGDEEALASLMYRGSAPLHLEEGGQTVAY